MWKQFFVLILVSIIVNVETKKKRVCIVGAGLSGLVTAKSMSEYPNEFETVVFEKNSDSGGLWIYTDSTTVDEHGLPVHSSMYKNLRTDSVKAEMSIPDYVSFGGDTNSNMTFAKHEEVLQYLRKYTDHFKLRQYIQFNSNVEKIKPLRRMRWLIITRNLNNNKISRTTCDAVVVCNGHNFKGYVPKISGIESFTGKVLHSHLYRKPEPYANQTVVVLGAAYSGIDIAIDVSSFATKIFLSHRHDKLPGALPSNLEQVPGVVGAEGDKLILSNGTRISADALIFATGYDYHYPFLDKNSGITIEGGRRFHTIYKYMFNVERPTMAFVDVTNLALHFLLVHTQANYIRKVFLGKLRLPSREHMQLEADMQLAKQLPGKAPVLTWDEFFKYFDEITHESDGIPLPWWARPYAKELEKQYNLDPLHFKDKKLVLHENNHTVEFI